MFLAKRSFPWFALALTAIFLLSVFLRFWRLGQFNVLVFDEVYYAIFANNYLIGKPFFNAHPPLSQYIIAIGIWIGSHLPIGQETSNYLTGSLRTTFSYRWINALSGSFIPLIVGAIAYSLTFRKSYAIVAALFLATDGLFLVESRYALNNIYLVLFGLLGQLFFLLALNNGTSPRWRQLTLSGIFFGAAAAIKWNGLGFLLGIYLLWILAWGIDLLQSLLHRFLPTNTKSRRKPLETPLQRLTEFNLPQIIGYLGIIPVLTYSLSWIPHLMMNPRPGFWQMQSQILTFHQKIGSGAEVHPYCSRWYSWLLMWRPVAYFYHTAPNTSEPVPVYPPLPRTAASVIYDVHAMGNPILWWFSTAAILLLTLFLVLQCFSLLRKGKIFLTPSTGIALYLVINYAANLLPWVKVSRCTFLYHYMGSLVFAELALAWIVADWLNRPFYRQLAIGIIILIVLAFLFWLPIYLGLPLSTTGYRLRMWFENWI